MKALNLVAWAGIVACTCLQARAATPTGLILDDRGNINITTDTLPGLQIRTEIKDVSSREWKNTTVKQKTTPAQGNEVIRTETRTFLDGTEVAHTVKASVHGKEVDVDASWVPTANARGFSRVDLWVPQDIVEDMVMTIGEANAFRFGDGQIIRTFANTAPLVARRKSNGEFLFSITGDYVSVTPAYYENAKGLTVRLLNVPSDIGAQIQDKTTLNWKISFDQP